MNRSAIFLPALLLTVAMAQTSFHASPETKSLKFQGTSYTAYANGKKIWEIHANQVKGTLQKVKVSHIQGTLYRKEKPVYSLESGTAYVNLSNNNIFFPQGAILQSTKGEHVHVNALLWDEAAKRFIGTKGVELVRLNTRLQGDQMILKSDFGNLILLGHVKAFVQP